MQQGQERPDYDVGDYPYTSPVGSFAANEYGLYDMTGNVYEWCWDWYDDGYYWSSASVDPRGPASGSYRVFRGSAWTCDGRSWVCRVACRSCTWPDDRFSGIGFRCVLPPGQ